MKQHNKSKSIWCVTLLIAVVLGIWPGVALTQSQHLVLLGALLGWFTFPLVLLNLIAGRSAMDPVLQHFVLAACGYPLAVLGYSACVYLTMQYRGTREKMFHQMFIAVGVSMLASIPINALTRSINQNQDILTNNPFGFVLTYALVLFNLMVSAILGWLLGWLLDRRLLKPTE